MLKSSHFPTMDQIAKLNSLLQTLEERTRKINDPYCIFLYTGVETLLRNSLPYTSMEVYAALNEWFKDTASVSSDTSYYASLGVLICLAPLIYYGYYKSWQATANFLSYFFPNGIGFSLEKSKAYEMQNKLGNREEINNIITELEKLTEEQKNTASRNIKWSFLISLGFPIASWLFSGAQTVTVNNEIITKRDPVILQQLAWIKDNQPDKLIKYGELIQNGQSFQLELPRASFTVMLNRFGFYLTLRHADMNTSFDFFKKILGQYQALQISRFIYKSYVNYNTPTQLDNFIKRLNKLSCIDSGNLFKHNSSKEKQAVIFESQLNSPHIKCSNSIDNKQYSISKANYLLELHRVLQQENIPVYAVGDEKIFVGFCELSEKRSRKIRTKLMERLISIADYEKNSNNILRQLNGLAETIGLPKDSWDGRIYYSEQGVLKTHYYSRSDDISVSDYEIYAKALNDYTQNADLKEKSIISLHNILLPVSENEFNELLQSLKNNIKKPEIIIVKQSKKEEEEEEVTYTKKNTKKNKKDDSIQEKSVIVKSIENKLPGKINFGKGVCFFKDLGYSDDDKNNRAYPLPLPWLPEDKGYVSIDPRIYFAVSEHCDKFLILHMIQRAKVHGSKASHTKAAATGFQISSESFTDLDGKQQTAVVKLKTDNNIRIFAHKANEVQVENNTYIHYRLDGWNFGH